MNRWWYFGTQGCAGHYTKVLKGPQMTNEENETLTRFSDNEKWMRNFYSDNYKHQDGNFVFYAAVVELLGVKWSVIGIPRSVDDKRGGCHTEIWFEGVHNIPRLIFEINHHPFLKRQFGL